MQGFALCTAATHIDTVFEIIICSRYIKVCITFEVWFWHTTLECDRNMVGQTLILLRDVDADQVWCFDRGLVIFALFQKVEMPMAGKSIILTWLVIYIHFHATSHNTWWSSMISNNLSAWQTTFWGERQRFRPLSLGECFALEPSLMTKFFSWRSTTVLLSNSPKRWSLHNYFHIITHRFISWPSDPWEKLSDSSEKSHSENTNTKYQIVHPWTIKLSYCYINSSIYDWHWFICKVAGTHNDNTLDLINIHIEYPHACYYSYRYVMTIQSKIMK